MDEDTQNLSRVTKRFDEGSLTQYQAVPEVRIEPGYSCVTLEVMNTELVGCLFVLPIGTYTLGRGMDADHLVLHPTVSRRHCVISVDKDRISIRDEGSAHGIVLNGMPVREGYLKERDVVQLGDVAMIVDIRFIKHVASKPNVRNPGDHRRPPK